MAPVQHRLLFEIKDQVIAPAAPVEITNLRGKIRHVIWNGATTALNKAALRDVNGALLWAATIQVVTSGSTRISDLNVDIPFDGLHCDDLDAGDLLIYVDFLGW